MWVVPLHCHRKFCANILRLSEMVPKNAVIIDREAGEIIRLVASVCPFVRPSVDLDLSLAGIEGHGRRSKFKVIQS